MAVLTLERGARFSTRPAVSRVLANKRVANNRNRQKDHSDLWDRYNPYAKMLSAEIAYSRRFIFSSSIFAYLFDIGHDDCLHVCVAEIDKRALAISCMYTILE